MSTIPFCIDPLPSMPVHRAIFSYFPVAGLCLDHGEHLLLVGDSAQQELLHARPAQGVRQHLRYHHRHLRYTLVPYLLDFVLQRRTKVIHPARSSIPSTCFQRQRRNIKISTEAADVAKIRTLIWRTVLLATTRTKSAAGEAIISTYLISGQFAIFFINVYVGVFVHASM